MEKKLMIILIIKQIHPGKIKNMNKWLKGIGEYSGKITKYSLKEEEYHSLSDNGMMVTS